MGKKKDKDSVKLFNDYYREIYQDKWDSLKKNLLEKSEPESFPRPLETPYYMDSASYFAATCLPLNKDDNVLDMCAAPGGKTLVLATSLNGTGHLTANDRSPSRRGRLKKVLSDCLTEEQKKNISITGHDSSKWGLFEKEQYDAVLLDAPCSSERHVLQDPKALKIWSPSRPKRLAGLQYSMLASAFTAVKTGGWILYSTCSINPAEDWKIIAKLMKKRPEQVIEIKKDTFKGIQKEFGSLILPSDQSNSGPLYYCLLKRIK